MITAHTGTLSICADAAAVAHSVAEHIIDASKIAIEARGAFVIALAGGSSPRAAYEYLALATKTSLIDWSRVLCLFGDERCVGPDHADSNYRMAYETLLSRVPVTPENVIRMRGEDEPAFAARTYSAEISARLGDDAVIDFVLLGLGPDAHTASWFPGVEINDDVLVDSPFVPKFNGHRLTLTPHVVNNARAIVVATSGAEKADALAAVLGSKRDPMNIPSQRLDPAHGSLTWLVDRAATTKL